MNLEEMLRAERDGAAPNPLLDRTEELVTRVRRRRRARAAAAGVVVACALAVVVVAGDLVPAGNRAADVTPAEGTVETTPPTPVPLRDVEADVPLDPGRYLVSIDAAPAAPLLPVLSVPGGFEAIGSIGVRTEDRARYVWVWDVTSVYTHPCDVGGDPAMVGPSVADLADALAAQPLREVADPVPVTIGGYDGLYLELSVPAGIDVAACREDHFWMWPGRAQEVPGQVDLVWIVDVDGERVVLDASHLPSATPQEVAELKNMVTTATFAARENG